MPTLSISATSSPPLPIHIHHASQIHANPSLAQSITTFVNTGYRYMSPSTLTRWHPPSTDRLKTAHHIHDMLDGSGFFAVIYNPDDEEKIIACAAAVSWEGDLEGGGGGQEKGWEIKTITTGREWQRRGLAGRCVEAICEEVVARARRVRRIGVKCDSDGGIELEKVRVWIQAVDDLNGVFWRKLGWVEVRRYEKPVGHWGSKLGYRLLVMVREFEIQLREGGLEGG